MQKIVTANDVRKGDVVRLSLSDPSRRVLEVKVSDLHLVHLQFDGVGWVARRPVDEVILTHRPFSNEEDEMQAVLAITEAIRVYEFGLVGGEKGRHDIRETLERYELSKPVVI